jgi:hypothetical protein
MKFLDLSGLTHFFGKVKTWAGNNYLSLEGGLIRGSVTLFGEYSLNIQETDEHYQRYVKIDYTNGISIGTHFDEGNETVDYVSINPSYISAPQFKKINGKSTQALIADGSVREIGSANGIAGLDANGYVPLAQLGNLDTTVAEVVTALPTTNIKKHIYLIKDASGVSQNQYEEYIYTGDTSTTYDASKWEKLGDFRATVDLADYAKKSEAVAKISHVVDQTHITVDFSTIDNVSLGAASFFGATNTNAGLMIPADKIKLNGIANNANNYSLPTASSTIKGGITLGYSQNGKNYPVVLDTNGKAYVNVPWIDTNTTYSLATSTNNGLMSSADKAKIDGIDTTYAKRMEVVGLDGIEIEKIPQGSFTVQSIVFPNVNKGDSVNITFEPATTSMDGFMSKNDKNKLNNIANGATADSAITTSEIDALFA